MNSRVCPNCGANLSRKRGRPKISPERTADIRVSLNTGMGIRAAARLHHTGNHVVARIKGEMTAAT